MSSLTSSTAPAYEGTALSTTMTVLSTAPVLTALSAFTLLVGFVWFVLELIIVSFNQGGATDYAVIAPLSAQTLQLFMYALLISATSYGASWYAHVHPTRAARQLALFVSAFSVFAWMWQLWFVIPTLRGKGDPSNLYCDGADTRYCRTSQAVSSMSIILEFTLVLNLFWTLFVALTSAPADASAQQPNAQSTTDAIDADDQEIMRIAANKPNVFDAIRQRISTLSAVNYAINSVTLAGWIILTLSSIQLSKDVGIAAYTTAISNTQRWGDPIIATLWFPLTLTLGVSIGAAAYSSFRMNRTVTATAMLLASLTALQWWSFFIYSARRFQQSNDTFGLSSLTDKAAQRAMVSGAGIIMCAETIKAVVLILRYITYLPITHADQNALRINSQHDAPTVIVTDIEDRNKLQTVETATDANIERDVSTAAQPYYNQPILSGTSIYLQTIFFAQLIAFLTFWCVEFVFSCNSGLFTITPGSNPAYAPEQSFYFSQILFLYQTVLILSAFFASFQAERQRSLSSAWSAFFVVTLSIGGWFLLIWPTAFQSLPNQVGDISSAACVEGTGDWCRLAGAASVLSFITLFILTVVWLHSIFRLIVTSRQASTGLNGHQISSSVIGVVMLSGIAIWSLATIRIGVTNGDFFAQQQQQFPQTDGASIEETYWASQVFLILTILSMTALIGVDHTLSSQKWQSWVGRLYSWLSSNVLVAVLLPFFVLTCRFIQSQSLNSVHLGVASGVIILFAGAVFFHLSVLYRAFDVFSPQAALPVAVDINTTKSVGMPTTIPAIQTVPNPNYTSVPVAEQV